MLYQLNNMDLFNSYERAVQLQLEPEFISMLNKEIKRRNLYNVSEFQSVNMVLIQNKRSMIIDTGFGIDVKKLRNLFKNENTKPQDCIVSSITFLI
jgi:glyoxylase-like metal-dependent hydrolase (beta-lactamase superfamily II)